MSATATRAPSQSPPGLLAPRDLKPWAILRRLRPLTLTSVGRRLLAYHRLILGLSLIQKHFPTEVWDEYCSDLTNVKPTPDSGGLGTGWWQVVAHIANLVGEKRWFEINWDALNEAWAWWLQEEDDGEHLAVFLQFIPIQLYGFSVGDTLFECPPMELLHALLAPTAEVTTLSAQLLIDTEIYDELDEVWHEADRQRAWGLLDAIEADPGRYPEPVRWLPELARWACQRTGNFILDRTFDPYQDGPWFSWDELAEVKHAWQRAQPVIRVFERLLNWTEADATHIAVLAHFIMQGGSTDELDW